MSGNCLTCIHWEHPRGHYRDAVRTVRDERPYEARRDEQAALDSQYGRCKGIDMPPDREAGEPVPLAVVIDGSDYSADLLTLPEFGCALHTTSPPPNLSTTEGEQHG